MIDISDLELFDDSIFCYAANYSATKASRQYVALQREHQHRDFGYHSEKGLPFPSLEPQQKHVSRVEAGAKTSERKKKRPMPNQRRPPPIEIGKRIPEIIWRPEIEPCGECLFEVVEDAG